MWDGLLRSALVLRPRAAVLIAAAALLASGARAPADLPLFEVAPKSVRQGDCAFVSVRPGEVQPAAGECRWLGKVYSLFPHGDGYRAIIPVSPDAPAGRGNIVVALQAPGGETRDTSLPVTIVKRDFGVQNLRMSKQTTRLYTDPETAQEGKTIHTALEQMGSEQLWRGSFAWPVKGRVSTQFGMARSINGQIQYRHRGLDIAAPQGTSVFAPADGVITLVREGFKLHGKTVVIDHGQGVASLYLHLSEIIVQEGQRVTRGERIGRVGATGAATAAHLHWAVYVAGDPVDPHFWMNLPQIGG